MKVMVEVNVDCCDDCPFLVYTHEEDLCTLSEEGVDYPSAFDEIPLNCPLKEKNNIKYNNIKVIKWVMIDLK